MGHHVSPDSEYGGQDFPSDTRGKEPICQWRRHRLKFDCWVRTIPWRRAQQPTPVFLPGESHGQRSLVGYSPWGCKQSDTTEATQHACTWEITNGNLITSQDYNVFQCVVSSTSLPKLPYLNILHACLCSTHDQPSKSMLQLAGLQFSRSVSASNLTV